MKPTEMPVRLFRTPPIVKALLPGLIWSKPGTGNVVYLTFDDGPIPEVTPFVLAELKKYEAKATFFCVGDNLHKYPHLAQTAILAGHSLANHTQNHLRGWKTPTQTYLANVRACEATLREIIGPKINYLFRAPYGSLTWPQYKILSPDYKIIMWDVLTYDFDKNLPEEVCLKRAIENTKPGSIVVFHDSLKARRNLQYVLPRYLANLDKLGFRFEAL